MRPERKYSTERVVSPHEAMILRIGHRICAAVYSGQLSGINVSRLPARGCACPSQRICDHMRLAAEQAIAEIMGIDDAT